ncbi:MAG: cobalamin-binding protein [Pseudohongiellaceae bacterium]
MKIWKSLNSRAVSVAIGALVLFLSSLVQAQIEVVDDLGNSVRLEKPATRIVSLAPHITESLYAIGAGENIVGTVRYSDFPLEASEIPIIGSFDEVSYESLLTLNPDLVIVWASGNGSEITSRIKSLGLTVFLDEPRDIEDVPSSLRRFGLLTGNEIVAAREADSFISKLNSLRDAYSDSSVVDVFYQVWNDPITTLNGEHLISDIIQLCGGRNVFAETVPIAPVVSIESVLTADPQVIVASGLADERPEWLDDWKDWSGLRASDTKQLYSISADLLQRNAPRVIQGAELMCEALAQARTVYSH